MFFGFVFLMINSSIFNSNTNYVEYPLVEGGIYSKKERVIVIGDLHADFKKTKLIFQKLNLIDSNNNWIGGNTHIVQLGDQIDGKRMKKIQASGEVEIINFLEKINTQARKKKGAVHSLIGNHELMNLCGDFEFASDKDIEEQEKISSRSEIFKPGGVIFGNLADSRHAILKIGDLVFSHAGILPSIIDDDLSGNEFILKINLLMKEILKGKHKFFNDEIKKYFIGNESILFNRILGKPTVKRETVELGLEKIGAKHMFIGHTIQKKVNALYKNLLWRLDVGISDSFPLNQNIQVLEVLGNGKEFNVIRL